MMNLSKFIEMSQDFNVVTVTNIDDIFRQIQALGVKEVVVNREQMNHIVHLYLATSGDKDPDKPEIIRENVIKKFYGVKLILK